MRTLVLHPDLTRHAARRDAGYALQEAESLTDALGVDVVDALIVPVPKPRAGTLFGPGKVEEFARIVEAQEIGLVVINSAVTPVQQRNLERAWKAKVLDRVGLILEIFGERAATREGVLQVDLAHLSYQRSRLVRSWTHLERQRGGLGFVGGPGETQIEADRRAIDDQMQRIRKQLRKVVNTRELHRSARRKVPFPTVALVGYTNSGKSTLFNRLTGASVVAEDMLFATLDPTMRAIELPDGRTAILSDTVGFISELPTQLVAAFRATLEEVLDADLILHVRDIAHPQSDQQAEDVREILTELGVDEERQSRVVEIWNKMDIVPPDQVDAVRNSAERNADVCAVSALTGEGMQELLECVGARVQEPTCDDSLHIPYEQGDRRAWLYDQKVVTQERSTEDGYVIEVTWSGQQKARFSRLDRDVPLGA